MLACVVVFLRQYIHVTPNTFNTFAFLLSFSPPPNHEHDRNTSSRSCSDPLLLAFSKLINLNLFLSHFTLSARRCDVLEGWRQSSMIHCHLPCLLSSFRLLPALRQLESARPALRPDARAPADGHESAKAAPCKPARLSRLPRGRSHVVLASKRSHSAAGNPMHCALRATQQA